MLRLDENPEPRYPPERELEEDLGLWRVARVKSRQEKALAHDLAAAGISYYLPMYEKRVRRRDNNKLRKSWLPLFAGYLAFALEDEASERIYATRRVVGVMPVADQELFVSELAQVQRALRTGAVVTLLPAFQPGQPVRVKDGPLQGTHGEVVTDRGRNRFIIRVRMFNQAVSVDVDEASLEAV